MQRLKTATWIYCLGWCLISACLVNGNRVHFWDRSTCATDYTYHQSYNNGWHRESGSWTMERPHFSHMPQVLPSLEAREGMIWSWTWRLWHLNPNHQFPIAGIWIWQKEANMWGWTAWFFAISLLHCWNMKWWYSCRLCHCSAHHYKCLVSIPGQYI